MIRTEMKKTRGLGFVYQPTYVDKRTGERRTAATWRVQYPIRGKRFRESSGSSNQADAVKLLKRRIGEAAQGKPVGPNVERTTFEDLARILLDDYKANGRAAWSALKTRTVICVDSLATPSRST